MLAALTILAEIGDIKRFASAKKLASYAGLVPRFTSQGRYGTPGILPRLEGGCYAG
ncbi:MAG TPA: IS110 family transposase [Firmicutes bacterium]|nr:IS110 family transposase [Bacillota bacterium]